jgi:hypothetical protein
MTDWEEKEMPAQQQAPGKPTLMIATPMYGGMCTGHYVSGLLGTINKMKSVGVPVYWAQIMNESLITRARNELARLFLEKGFDYLMFIDADISFDGHAVAQLMAADRDIVCGMYPKKEIDWAKVDQAAKAGKKDLAEYGGAFVFNMVGEKQETDDEGCIEVRHSGTGFMLIKRRVFEILKDHVPTYRTSSFKDPETGEYAKPLTHEYFATSIDATGALLSEDYHFCDLWRKHGGKVYANPFIKLEHVGTYVFGGNVVRGGGNLK